MAIDCNYLHQIEQALAPATPQLKGYPLFYATFHDSSLAISQRQICTASFLDLFSFFLCSDMILLEMVLSWMSANDTFHVVSSSLQGNSYPNWQTTPLMLTFWPRTSFDDWAAVRNMEFTIFMQVDSLIETTTNVPNQTMSSSGWAEFEYTTINVRN